jgi:hypothetical protein
MYDTVRSSNYIVSDGRIINVHPISWCYPSTCLDRLTKSKINLSQYSLCPSQDLNQACSEHRPEIIPNYVKNNCQQITATASFGCSSYVTWYKGTLPKSLSWEYQYNGASNSHCQDGYHHAQDVSPYHFPKAACRLKRIWKHHQTPCV